MPEPPLVKALKLASKFETENAALRADLVAVAVAAKNAAEILAAQARLAGPGDSEAKRFLFHLTEALARPGVKKALKDA